MYMFVSHHVSARQALGGGCLCSLLVMPMLYSFIIGFFDPVTAYSWMSRSVLWTAAFLTGCFLGPINVIVAGPWVRPELPKGHGGTYAVDSAEHFGAILSSIAGSAYLHARQSFFLLACALYVALPAALGFFYFLLGHTETALGWMTLCVCMFCAYGLGIFTGPPYIIRTLPWTHEEF